MNKRPLALRWSPSWTFHKEPASALAFGKPVPTLTPPQLGELGSWQGEYILKALCSMKKGHGLVMNLPLASACLRRPTKGVAHPLPDSQWVEWGLKGPDS